MKINFSKMRLLSMFVVIALLTFAIGCTRNIPANAWMRAGDVKFLGHSIRVATDSRGYTISKSICTVTMQNVGSKPISGIKFRLTLRVKPGYYSARELAYSRVHILDLDLGPRDIVTKEFFTHEFVYNVPYDYIIDEIEVW